MENQIHFIAEEGSHNETLKGEGINEMKEDETGKDLFAQDVKQSEEKLTINCIQGKGEAEKEGNADQLSDASIFRREQKGCETLYEASKDAEKNKNGYFLMDSLVYHTEKVSGENICQEFQK